nr:hypothetical protein [Roseibium sp. CAU 1639]
MAARPFLAERLVRNGDCWPDQDGFTRRLPLKTALRAPLLQGDGDTGLSAATIACEADGAALVLLRPADILGETSAPIITIRAGVSLGGDPADPALVPIAAARKVLNQAGIAAADLAAIEVMEAYAVQAMVTMADLGLDPGRINNLGGALARGHPIGESGAILAVNLFERLIVQETPAEGSERHGLALIAAAGGLGTAMLFECRSEKVDNF